MQMEAYKEGGGRIDLYAPNRFQCNALKNTYGAILLVLLVPNTIMIVDFI